MPTFLLSLDLEIQRISKKAQSVKKNMLRFLTCILKKKRDRKKGREREGGGKFPYTVLTELPSLSTESLSGRQQKHIMVLFFGLSQMSLSVTLIEKHSPFEESCLFSKL